MYCDEKQRVGLNARVCDVSVYRSNGNLGGTTRLCYPIERISDMAVGADRVETVSLLAFSCCDPHEGSYPFKVFFCIDDQILCSFVCSDLSFGLFQDVL